MIGLILACRRLAAAYSAGLRAPFRLVYSADWAFWAFNKLMPVAYSSMMVSKAAELSQDEAKTMAEMRKPLFPFKLPA